MVFAMAPALGPALLPESLERIDIPVAIVAGAADAIAPIDSNARSYAAHIPGAELTIFPGAVGHYVFTVNCTEAGRATVPAMPRRTRCRRRRHSCRDCGARRGIPSPAICGSAQAPRRYQPVVKAQPFARLAERGILI